MSTRRLRPSLRWLRTRGTLRPDDVFFRDCHRRIDGMLQGAIAFWMRTVDWDGGGFFGLVDYAGVPRADADKDLVQQARHLWTFSQIHRLEDASPKIRAIADHQLDFLRERFYAGERDEFHAAVAADGTPRAGPIHLYHLAFAIHGLANYALAFPATSRGRDALRMAKATFERMVEKSYDDVDGFDETVYSGRWCESAKEINTQMHVMEAVAELLEAARAHTDGSARAIAAILDRQVTLVATRAIVSRGSRHFCARGYDRDWTLAVDWEIDFGHDIEAVYLTMAAARTLGREREPAIVEPVLRLGRSVTGLAYDRVHGKWLYSGNPRTGEILQRASNVWTNFEALNGLATMFDLTRDVAYLDKLERVLTWLETKQINRAVGEWYYAVDDSGRPLDLDVYGNDCAWMTFPWKASYHTVRALIARKRWLEDEWGITSRP